MTCCARSNSRSLQPSGTSTTHSATVLFSAGFVHVATGVGSPMNLYMRQQAGRGLRNPLARLASTRMQLLLSMEQAANCTTAFTSLERPHRSHA